jgi:hypothetical protein
LSVQQNSEARTNRTGRNACPPVFLRFCKSLFLGDTTLAGPLSSELFGLWPCKAHQPKIDERYFFFSLVAGFCDFDSAGFAVSVGDFLASDVPLVTDSSEVDSSGNVFGRLPGAPTSGE